jgi:hypothetical protein
VHCFGIISSKLDLKPDTLFYYTMISMPHPNNDRIKFSSRFANIGPSFYFNEMITFWEGCFGLMTPPWVSWIRRLAGKYVRRRAEKCKVKCSLAPRNSVENHLADRLWETSHFLPEISVQRFMDFYWRSSLTAIKSINLQQ